MSGLEAIAFQSAPDATLILGDRVILRANQMVETVFGWRPRDLEGQSVRVLYPGAPEFDLIGARAYSALREMPVYRDERFMRRRDGQILWVEGRGRTLDLADPARLSVWTYRLVEAGVPALGPLTPTEARVARYLVNGFTSKEIGQALGSSHRTVEVHRANMIRKLGVRNSSELVHKLLAEGGGGA